MNLIKNDWLNLFFEDKTKKIKKIKNYKKSSLMGCCVDVKGRIRNSNRSKKIGVNYGKVKKNTSNIFTHLTKQPINTKTGIWMLKIHLLRNTNQ